MAQEIQFSLFANGSPIGKNLVGVWYQRANEAAGGQHHDSFDVFTRLWTGFNLWAMRVTEADSDREMVQRLAESPALNKAFAEGVGNDPKFLVHAKAFAAVWPIFNVKDIRRKGLRHQFLDLNRPEYIRQMRSRRVQQAPERSFDRDNPTWKQTIQAIYVVRCNLTHGEKGDASEDYLIVEGAYRILLSFIDRVNLYSWQ